MFLFLLLVCINVRIQCIFGNTEVFCHLVAGLGHQERPGLVQEPDGPDLVVLVHQGHGLAHQGHGLLDELVQDVVDVDDALGLRLLLVLGGQQIDTS